MIEHIKQQIKSKLEQQLSTDQVVVETPKKGFADLAIPLFGYVKSKQIKMDLAYQTFADILGNEETIETIELSGGFLNIYLNRKLLSDIILTNEQTFDIGQGKTIVIDYSSPNIAKSFGVGHLRSTVIGNALKNIYLALGYQVIGINHLGDWGTQFGRMIVAYQKWGDEAKIKKNPIVELQKLYVYFHEQEQEDPSLTQAARDAFLELEKGNPEYTKLWETFRAESLKEFMKIYDLLGVSFDSYAGEAFYNDKMDAAVEKLAEKRLLKIDQGATIVDLGEAYPPALIKRSDGGTLYITRDLAALLYRYETYHFDKILYVVGNEQRLHLNQLKALSNLLDYDFQIEHINFGLILVDGKKMSSRKGKFKKLDSVIKKAIKQAKEAISEKNPNLKHKAKIAASVGIGAIIFNDLKNDRHLDIEFNIDNMLRFEGQTGPYLQYTSVRIASILREHPLDVTKADKTVYEQDHYFEIIKLLGTWSQTLKRAADQNAPSVISRYLLSLAQSFNKFYGQQRIAVEDETIKQANLLFIFAIRSKLNQGLAILGIDSLEEM